MLVSELFDIEPGHTDVQEISRRRLDYGDGYAPVGYARLWLHGRVPGAGIGDADSELFGIYGVRGRRLLVRYLVRPRRGSEPYFWVDADLFGTGTGTDGIEILSKVRQPLPERYWHPNWRGISALPPLRE